MLENYFLSDQFWLHLELFGVITGLLFLYIEIKQRPTMWLIGGISSLVYVVVFGFAKIYADMSFNMYNFIISIYGFFMWLKVLNENSSSIKDELKKGDSQIEYSHIGKRAVWIYFISIIVIYFLIYNALSKLTDSPIPAYDAFTTTLSIIATILLVKKIIEHWGLWIIINIVSMFIYYDRGLYPTVVLYMIYAFASVYGYYEWKKKGLDRKSVV